MKVCECGPNMQLSHLYTVSANTCSVRRMAKESRRIGYNGYQTESYVEYTEVPLWKATISRHRMPDKISYGYDVSFKMFYNRRKFSRAVNVLESPRIVDIAKAIEFGRYGVQRAMATSQVDIRKLTGKDRDYVEFKWTDVLVDPCMVQAIATFASLEDMIWKYFG